MSQLSDGATIFMETHRETMEDEPTGAQLDPEIPASQWKYIVVGYTEQQQTRNNDIQEKDVVCPKNHRWCFKGGAETKTWLQKSTQRCPMYGSCDLCYRSGPVGKVCIKHKGGKYKVIIHPMNRKETKIFTHRPLPKSWAGDMGL